MSRFTNIVDGCEEYIGILSGPPNGFGGQSGPDGLSHNTLAKLGNQFGKELVNAELDRQFTDLHLRKVASLETR